MYKKMVNPNIADDPKRPIFEYEDLKLRMANIEAGEPYRTPDFTHGPLNFNWRKRTLSGKHYESRFCSAWEWAKEYIWTFYL